MEEGRRVTNRDLLRMDLIAKADKGDVTGSQVAQALGISVRQVRRLISALRKKGAGALIHGNRGKVSPSRLPDSTRETVLQLLRSDYADYNTAHARDDLEEFQGLRLSYSALYRLRRSAGLATPRHHRVAGHRTRRQRAGQEGLLLQADGSEHAWLEQRGPHLTLVAYIDDATGRIAGAIFREQEDVVGYLTVLRDICATYGVPQTLYTDRHTLFGPPPKATIEQQLRHEQPRSHIQCVLEKLGVQRIPAHSPQAKGRVERLFGTLQDRLTKVLRRANACTCAEANRVLAIYLPHFNARFGLPARMTPTAYRTWPPGLAVEQVFCFHYERIVASDNTVAFAALRLPIPPSPTHRHFARGRVELRMALDGRLDIFYHGECIATYAHAPGVPVRADSFVPAMPITYAETQVLRPTKAPTTTERTVNKPAANHPWRRLPIGL